MADKDYLSIVKHYEKCLEEHGDTFRGVDWPKEEDVDKRYEVMLGVIRRPIQKQVTVLDFGCGASHLYEYIDRKGISNIEYVGLDISPRFIELCRSKFPNLQFYCIDALDPDAILPKYDYAIMNGVFTEKCNLSFDYMLDYFKKMVKTIFDHAQKGIAFNVMSKQVDWERNDLFHLPLDTLAWFLKNEMSRHFVIRNDYGLYEYTAYVYKHSFEGTLNNG